MSCCVLAFSTLLMIDCSSCLSRTTFATIKQDETENKYDIPKKAFTAHSASINAKPTPTPKKEMAKEDQAKK